MPPHRTPASPIPQPARDPLARPRLLVLDEATSALDPEREAQLCARLAALYHEGGMAILAIAHQPAWARIADRRYRISDGRVGEILSPRV